MENHLSEHQIEELLDLFSDQDPAPGARRSARDLLAHLNTCALCRARLHEQEKAMLQLTLLKAESAAPPGTDCPRDDVWIGLAAGLDGPDADEYLAHAAHCDHCGPLLQQAVDDLALKLSAEEESILANLRSSTPGWQKTLAARIMHGGVSSREKSSPGDRRLPRTAALPWQMRVAIAAMIAALLAAGTWMSIRLRRGPSAQQLMASAYAEKRTLDVRFDGAPYVPLRQERGGDAAQSRMSRPALLKAEAEIAQRLKSNPDDIVWLQASGRASLLEGGVAATDQALAVLEKAQQLDPANRSVSVDRASAYLMRGEIEQRPEDMGTAVELLARVLSADPHNESAQYNDAIALEKLNLNAQAVDAWQKFLALHPASPWSAEARQRLARLQQVIRDHDQRSSRPLEPVDQVAAAFAARRDAEIAAIDDRVEEYQDLAVEQWLPAYFDAQPAHAIDAATARAALSGLAELLKSHHQDEWLHDMTAADRNSAPVREAVRLLADSQQRMHDSDDDRAAAEAQRALLLFQHANLPAGVLRARFSLALMDQLQHDARKCVHEAHALAGDEQGRRYSWLQVQSRLEEDVCLVTGDQRALPLAEQAHALAQQHRFPILTLRAANFESGSYLSAGDRHHAWAVLHDSLQQFWDGAFPEFRGYALLANLHDMAEEQQQWFLETAVLKEALPMIAANPDHTMRAFEEDRLGEAELRADDVAGAENSFHDAQQLFAHVPPGARRDALAAETEVGLARAALDSGHAGDAVQRLDRVRPSILQIADDDLQIRFYQASGIAEFRAGLEQPAREDLNSAIRLAEQALRLEDREADRWKWRHRNEAAYRTLVELELASDPVAALRDWDRFKGATLRAENGTPSAHANEAEISRSSIAPGEAYVSYVLFPGQAAVWVSDHEQIRMKRLAFSQPELSALIRRFAEHCSDPASNPDQIRQEARSLYKILLEPVEPWIAGHRVLSIEPDGDLRALPFEILVNAQGEYLGDRFAVTTSPGVEYLHRARQWTGITPASAVSIIGNPQAPGWAPLPAADQEARAVAALFSHPRLMLDQAALPNEVTREIDRAQLFHFSGHASATVQMAGLVIGGPGPIDAFPIDESNHARTQLVVLSACDSSLGSAGYFDDEDSLVRRLMGARVPAIVASRWMVDSSATSELMKSFYAALLTGKPVSEALSSARRSLRDRPQFAHPFYWAGFSVFGRT